MVKKMLLKLLLLIWLLTGTNSYSADGIWKFFNCPLRAGAGYRIAVDHKNVVWVGTLNSELYYFENNNFHKLTNKPDELCGYELRGGLKIFVDDSNNKWFYNSYNIIKYDGNTCEKLSFDYWILVTFGGKTFKKLFRVDGANQIAQDKYGVLWFATDKGVGQLNKDMSWILYTMENNTLNYKCASAVAVDENNLKWFSLYTPGTDMRNVVTFDGKTWNIFNDPKNLLTGRYVREIATGINGKICFLGMGLVIYNGKSWYIIEGKISSIAYDKNGALWYSEYDYSKEELFKGVYGNGNWYYNDHSWFDYIQNICVDDNNVKWFAASKGIWSYDENETDIEEDNKLPDSFSLQPNHPNPFNSSTTISFTLPSSGFTSLVIYNIMGQKIRELVSDTMNDGTHSITWDGCDDGGVSVSSGIYIASLKTGEYTTSGQMLLIK